MLPNNSCEKRIRNFQQKSSGNKLLQILQTPSKLTNGKALLQS